MIRLPYENYLRYLITCGLNYDETSETIKELELPPCPSEYWEAQFEILNEVQIPNKIKKCWATKGTRKPKSYGKYMGAIGLYEAWDEDKTAFNKVLDIAQDPDVSMTIGALLLRRTEKEEIAAILLSKFSINIPPSISSLYEKYFFQVAIMSRAAWKVFLGHQEGFTKKVYYLALSGKDMKMRAELGLPNRISVSEHYQQLHIQAIERFKTLMETNSPDADAMALKWATLAMSSGDKYEKLKLGDASDFGKDLQMEFEYIDTNFPGIGESDLDQVQANIDTGEAKDHHEPIPLSSNPIKEDAD